MRSSDAPAEPTDTVASPPVPVRLLEQPSNKTTLTQIPIQTKAFMRALLVFACSAMR
jgi:hypothetical protein